jgi:hypothetical protein
MLQSLRLCKLAIDALLGFMPPTAAQKSTAEDANPFEISDSAMESESITADDIQAVKADTPLKTGKPGRGVMGNDAADVRRTKGRLWYAM